MSEEEIEGTAYDVGFNSQRLVTLGLDKDPLTNDESTYNCLEDSDSGLADLSVDEKHISTGVNRLIFDCRIRRAFSLDLSRRELTDLPEAVLNIDHLEVAISFQLFLYVVFSWQSRTNSVR